MRRVRRPRVWLVDDREENRTRFKTDHATDFDVEVFDKPDDVLRALDEKAPPDALLCDIYFYPDRARGDEGETRVKAQADALRALGERLGARGAETGIKLIEEVRSRFGGDPPFPIYAYTSKGPYLMQHDGFEQLERLGARWLFKGRYDPATERLRIRRGIAEVQAQHSWPRRIWQVAVTVGAISAGLGAFLSVVFDRLARHWGW